MTQQQLGPQNPDQETIFSYYTPYKNTKIFIKFFKPTKIKFKVCLLLIHWMDKRGHLGNVLYNQLGEYYSSNQGIPVFLFDLVGSGKSKGNLEFPNTQKDQIKTVVSYIKDKLAEEYDLESVWSIIPIAHSISIIGIMKAINEGLSINKLIWIGGPPSHTQSFYNSIKAQGTGSWNMYRILSRMDTITGIVGIKLRKNIFGYKLRLKDIRKFFSDAHGAKLILNRPDLDSLVIFGSDDEYMSINDINKEFGPLENYDSNSHVKIVILEGANHGFKGKTNELITILNPFICRLD